MKKKLGDSVIDSPLKQILKPQVHVTKPGIKLKKVGFVFFN